MPQLLVNYTQSLRSNCPNRYLSSYSNYECTNLCRVALQQFKLNVGCCLNSYYNISFISAYDSNSQYTDAGLWSACSVSPPSFCQASTLTLGSVATSRTCSGVEVFEQIHTQTTCNAQVFQPTLDIYKDLNKQCYYSENVDYYELFIQYCGLNENNQFCLEVLNVSYPQVVVSQCQNYTQGCTRSCHMALNTFKTALGCCVNFYNGSFLRDYSNSSLRDYLNTTNPALWSACGIPMPEFCTSTLLSQTTRSPSDSTTFQFLHRAFLLCCL